MKKSFIKRLLSALIVVVMLIGLLPMAVSAEEPTVTVGTPITADPNAWGTQNNNGWYYLYKLTDGSYHEMSFWADPWTGGTNFASNLSDTIEMFFITPNTAFIGENGSRPTLAYCAPVAGTVELRMQTHSTTNNRMQVYVGGKLIKINGVEDSLQLCQTGRLDGGMTLTTVQVDVQAGEMIYVEFYGEDLTQRQVWFNEYSVTYLSVKDTTSIAGTTFAPDYNAPAWGTQNNNNWYFQYKLADGTYHDMPCWNDPWTAGTGFASDLSTTVEMFFITPSACYYGENATRPVYAFKAPESGNITLRTQTHSSPGTMHMQVYVGKQLIQIGGEDSFVLTNTGSLPGAMTLTTLNLDVKKNDMVYVEFYSTDIGTQRQAWINEMSVTYNSVSEDITGTSFTPDLSKWPAQGNNNWFYMYQLLSNGNRYLMDAWADPWGSGGFASNLADTVEMFFIQPEHYFLGENGSKMVYAFLAPADGLVQFDFESLGGGTVGVSAYIDDTPVKINGEDRYVCVNTGTLEGGFTATSFEAYMQRNQIMYLVCDTTDANARDGWFRNPVATYIECPHENTTVLNAAEATCTATGYTGDEVCDLCGAVITPGEEIAALGHDYQPDETIEATCTAEGSTQYACSRCDASYEEVLPMIAHNFVNGVCTECGTPDPDAVLKVKSAYLRINEDINIIFTAKVPAGCENPYMVIDFVNGSYKIEDYTVNADGMYCFEFKKVIPSYMGENITATVYATKDGETVSDVVADYSIKDYCVSMIEKNPDNADLKTLLSDILVYGAAAQTYTGYKTDALVTSGLDLTPSTFSAIEKQKAVLTGEKSEAADWTSATVCLSNELGVRFYFTAESTDGLTVDVTMGDRTETFDAADFGTAPSGRYFVTMRGIKATEFDEAVTASFKQNGTAIGRTVSYSVNTYISGVQDYSDATVAALAQALYNYGVSAAAYVNSEPADPAEEPEPEVEPEKAWVAVKTGTVSNEGWQTLIP